MMPTKRSLTILASLFLFVSFGLEFSPGAIALDLQQQPTAEIGKAAPDFMLLDTYGNTHSLKEYKGKHVVLEWINHDCPFVRKHYNSGNMQSLQKFTAENDIVWLSIGSSAPGEQGNFEPGVWNQLTEEKGAMPTAILLDSEGVVGKVYGAQTTPHMYIVNPAGALIYAGAIDSIPSVDIDDISEAQNYVKAALRESLAGKEVSVSSTKAYGCSVKYA